MFKVRDYYNILDSIAPFRLAESWDNVGLLIGALDDEVRGVMLALDVNHGVVDEAVKAGANLIITHHPIIFTPLKTISSNDIVYCLIKNSIAVIATHTNLDIAPKGVSYALANALNLSNVKGLSLQQQEEHLNFSVYVPVTHAQEVKKAITKAGAGDYGSYKDCVFATEGEGFFTPQKGSQPYIGDVNVTKNVEEIKLETQVSRTNLSAVLEVLKDSHPYQQPVYRINRDVELAEKHYYGKIGNLEKEMTVVELANFAKENLCAISVRYTQSQNSILRVAVMGGSGGDWLECAAKAGAQAFITGEIAHHQLLKANELGVVIIDVGHFASENIVLPVLKELLDESIKGNIQISRSFSDGIIGI